MACVVAAGIVLFAWLNPRLHVSGETFASIRPQMTESDIEALLGGRGSKADLPLAKGEGVVEAWTHANFQGNHESLDLKQWRAGDKCIKIGFDADGKAVYGLLTKCFDMTLWERFRLWIGM